MSIAIKYFNNQDDAAICVNDSFIKICNNIKKYDQKHSFITWSKTILIRTVLDEIRKQKKYKETIVITNEVEIYEKNEANNYYEIQDLKPLKNSLKKLPNATRNIINLHLIEGFSHKEIAEMMKISIQTSQWHVKTGKQKLRKLLDNNTN